MKNWNIGSVPIEKETCTQSIFLVTTQSIIHNNIKIVLLLRQHNTKVELQYGFKYLVLPLI